MIVQVMGGAAAEVVWVVACGAGMTSMEAERRINAGTSPTLIGTISAGLV
jgi:hypothetical protein